MILENKYDIILGETKQSTKYTAFHMDYDFQNKNQHGPPREQVCTSNIWILVVSQGSCWEYMAWPFCTYANVFHQPEFYVENPGVIYDVIWDYVSLSKKAIWMESAWNGQFANTRDLNASKISIISTE